MAVSKEQVLAALEGVRSPDGTPLPRSGMLSEVVAGDGKVFFSITVDAGAVKPGRRCASVPSRPCARCPACKLRSWH